MIRRPRPNEIKLLPHIENNADLGYARVGLRRVTDMPPASLASLELARRRGLLWMAVSRFDRPVGFAFLKLRGGTAWLDQLSVLDRWQGQGHGTALVGHSIETARALGFDALYLSTYRGVPWNAPFYERRGFREALRGTFALPLRSVLMTERNHGHPVWRRAIMRQGIDLSRR
jgi:GNAT superfamily N-acetyltransferase